MFKIIFVAASIGAYVTLFNTNTIGYVIFGAMGGIIGGFFDEKLEKYKKKNFNHQTETAASSETAEIEIEADTEADEGESEKPKKKVINPTEPNDNTGLNEWGNNPTKPDEPKGFGGWLIFILIGVIVSPIRLIVLIEELLTYIEPELWTLITKPGSDTYHPLAQPLIVSEIIGNILFLFISVYLAFLFFTKKKAFIKTYVIFGVTSTLFILLDDIFGNVLISYWGVGEPEYSATIQTIVGFAIWIPYVLKSKRVKNTFVK